MLPGAEVTHPEKLIKAWNKSLPKLRFVPDKLMTSKWQLVVVFLIHATRIEFKGKFFGFLYRSNLKPGNAARC